VRDFQIDAGITVDGKVGPQTRSALAAAYEKWLATGTVRVEAMDRNSVPRAGRILGARLLVQGGLSPGAAEALRIDAGVTESTTGEAKGTGADADGPLAELFRMEKELVYGIVGALDVTLTDEEKDAIGRVPTRNVNAFLAWSEGLVFEDRDRLDLARQSYARALDLDPGFRLARERLDAISGSPEGLARVEGRLADQAQSGGGDAGDAVRERLDLVGAINGRGLGPGRSGDDELDPTVTAVGAAGAPVTVIVTGRVPQ
jgi:hypothetical protein